MKDTFEALKIKARKYLRGKQYTKAKRIARHLGITTQHAGKILQYLPEWEPWNDGKKPSDGFTWERAQQ